MILNQRRLSISRGVDTSSGVDIKIVKTIRLLTYHTVCRTGCLCVSITERNQPERCVRKAIVGHENYYVPSGLIDVWTYAQKFWTNTIKTIPCMHDLCFVVVRVIQRATFAVWHACPPKDNSCSTRLHLSYYIYRKNRLYTSQNILRIKNSLRFVFLS